MSILAYNPPQRYLDHVRLVDNRAVHVCWVCRKATLAQIAYTIVHISVTDAACAFCGATNAFGRLDFDAAEPEPGLDYDDLPDDFPGYDDENGVPHAAVTLSLAELLAGFCPACEADILGGQHCTCAADDAHVDWMIGRAMAEQEGRVW